MSTEREDKRLAGQLGQQLRDSEDTVDELTTARLRAARRQALDAGGKRVTRDRAGWALGGFASAAVAVIAIMMWQQGDEPLQDMFGEEWEMLAESDLQLIKELEFYEWLPEEEIAG